VRLTFCKGDNASDPEWMNEWKRGDGGWLGVIREGAGGVDDEMI
jgi:hypothetical protein